MKIIFAWALLCSLLYAGVVTARSWENPFKITANVLEVLPPSAAGCGVDCK